jgi:hypothetical protein
MQSPVFYYVIQEIERWLTSGWSRSAFARFARSGAAADAPIVSRPEE